jgi:hypothetical protein
VGAKTNELRCVRTPLSEVVIHIDGRNRGFAGSFLEPGDPRPNREGMAEKTVSIGKIEVTDDVDKNKRRRRSVTRFHAEGIVCFRAIWNESGFLFFSRFRHSFIVNWLADFKFFSSFHSKGKATGAPGRARTAKSAMAVAV